MVNRRGNVRRVPASRGRAVRRAIRSTLKRPMVPIRAKRSFRSGRGPITVTQALRSLTVVPSHLASNSPSGAWWIESLKWFSTIVAKLILTVLSDEVNAEAQLALPGEHLLKGKDTATSVPTGVLAKMLLGPEDLLGDSEFISKPGASYVMHYRSAKVEWIRVLIQPIPSVNNRAGMIAAALYSIPIEEAVEDFAAGSVTRTTWHELMRTPGVIYKTATTPTTLTFSPRPDSESYGWQSVGQVSASTRFKAGGDARYVLIIGYRNLASDTSDQTNNYTMSHATLNVTLESRILLREYEDNVVVRTSPMLISNPSSATVCEYLDTTSVDVENIHVFNGLYMFDRNALETSSVMSM